MKCVRFKVWKAVHRLAIEEKANRGKVITYSETSIRLLGRSFIELGLTIYSKI